jgi:pimeloyl-ACP methyl ester carboxylesterase
MPIINANGVDFHYLQAGSGPDLVLLHGLSGNLAVWHLRLVPLLQDRFRITTYDLRGHGYSSMPPTGYSTRSMAHDLRALMDALGIERADVLGHSYGADIALHFALLFPDAVRTLALVEPGIPALLADRADADWDGWAHWADVLEKLSGEPVPVERRNDVGYMLRRSVEVPIVYGPARGRPRRKDRILSLMDSTTMPTDYGVVDELTLDSLETIPHPKLLIYDAGSAWLSTFHVLKTRLQHCAPVLLPTTELRHFAPLDAPDLLADLLNKFIPPADFPVPPSAVAEACSETSAAERVKAE